MRTPHVAKKNSVSLTTASARLVSAVEAGLEDVAAGRVHTHAEVVREMRARFGVTRARSPGHR